MVLPKIKGFMAVLNALKDFWCQVLRGYKPFLIALEDRLNSGLKMIALDLILFLNGRILPLPKTKLSVYVKQVRKVDLVIQHFSTNLMDVFNELSKQKKQLLTVVGCHAVVKGFGLDNIIFRRSGVGQ